MPAANYNFNIEQGSDFALDFVYRDESGNLVDLSSSCVVFQFAFNNDTVCSKYVLSSLANSNYDTDNWSLSSDSSGNIKIRIAAELTKNFSGTAVYDLDIISSSNSLRNIRLSTGTITIIARNFTNLNYCPSNLDICFATPVLTSTDPVATGEIVLTPTPTQDPEDLCLPYECLGLDVYSMVYKGSGLNLVDDSVSSGYVESTDSRNIENIELSINGLNHSSPSDLQILLSPPSGNKILLSANQKIPNYNNSGSFTFMFSNKAPTDRYLYNCSNGDAINIYDKTSYINYNDETLYSSFDHLFSTSTTGIWTLIVRDTDPVGSGTISSWSLIITHEQEEE